MGFSIIIPLYNKESHIKRAINSILQQTYKNFEIIVVDDGSTDNSYREVNKKEDPRLFIYRKPNGGVSSARNFGIEKASYDYIGLLDADDVWSSRFLESISQLIQEYPQAGAYATSYEFKSINKSTKANINVNLDNDESDIVDYFKGALNDPLISASSVVIKKDVFKNIGLFLPELTRGEDLEMWCRIALNYQIVFLNKVLASYYVDSDNKATDIASIYSKSFMSLTEEILEKQNQFGNNSFYFEEYMIRRILNKARFLINNGKLKEARQILYRYKHTKCSKERWFKNYLLTFVPINIIYRKIKG